MNSVASAQSGRFVYLGDFRFREFGDDPSWSYETEPEQ